MAKTYKETAHDYRVMYEGCLVRLVNPAKNVAPIAQITSILSDGDNNSSPPTGFQIRQFVRKEVELGIETRESSARVGMEDVQLTLPPFGFINTGKSVLRIFHKKPSGSNKYRKLAVLQDVSLDHPVRDVLNKLKLNPVEDIVDYNVLNFWNSFDYAQPQEAIQGLFEGDFIGRAISSKFCLFISTKSPKVFLGYDRYVAGSISAPGEPIVLEDWATRFKDELETHGLEVA